MYSIPISNQKFCLCILQAILLSVYLPGFLCADSKAITYRAVNNRQAVLPCPGEPFSCGSIGYISYPFWGGNRPDYCGRPGFELVCVGSVPMLNISSLSYRVQEINFPTNTLRVATDDLWNNVCPKVLHNTTIDPNLFEIPQDSKDENVTMFFGCINTRQLPNQFPCDGNTSNAKTINIFEAGNASSDAKCDDNFFVPVNSEAAQSLKNPTASSINTLLAALNDGFSIQWREDAKQYQANVCNAKVYNNCRRSNSSISEGPTASGNAVRAPALSPGQSQGMPPLQNPTIQGMPPIQSPAYSPRSDHHGSSPQIGSKRGNPPARAGIIAGVVLDITSMVIVCSIIYYFLKRQCSPGGRNQECNQHVEKFLLKHGSLAPKRYKYFEIKKITKSFHDKLGQGGYGSVYKGMLPDGTLVAVKVLIDTNNNGEEFINEVASISRTSHINIVNLLGFCFDRNKRALVYEFMPNKSLDKFINNNGPSDVGCLLDLGKLYKIAVGVAKGLEYLHTGCNTRIVHFDIKPQNILLDDDFCPKISDFGLAKLCKKKQSILSMIGARGTIGYIAPEIFSRNFGGVSHKSNVYSYGMMLLEMAGARKIEKDVTIQSSENFFPEKIYELVVLDVTRKLADFVIEEEEEKTRKMFLVGFWCIQTNPSDRPSMSKVVEMLEGSIQSIQIPPKPILFCPTTLSGRKISPLLSEYIETDNSAEN